MSQVLLLVAPLVPLCFGLVMIFVRNPRWLGLLDVCSSTVVAALSLGITQRVRVVGSISALGLLRADALTVIFLLLVGLLAFATSVATVGWMRGELASGQMRADRVHYYYALVQAFIATMLVTVLSDNLGVLWIAMEGTTITSALLVGFSGKKQALEAAWKYIIVTTIGISFGLFGTVLIYGAATHAQAGNQAGAMNWSSIVQISQHLDPSIVRIGFIFVLVGYGSKAGLAPVHMWLPDAHSQAPSPVSALLSGALIKCALFGILRFFVIARNACGAPFSDQLLLIFGLLSVVVATPFILVQHDLKRLLGYHSVEHVGIIALGLGFGGSIGTYGALLHVINHGVTKALAFLCAGEAIGRYGTHDMRQMRGYLGLAPLYATLLLMSAFSLAGTPPFSIFMSELWVIRAGITSGHYVSLFVFLGMMVIIFAGLIHHVGMVVFGTAPSDASRRGEPKGPLLGLALLAVVMLILGVTIPVEVDCVLRHATEIVLG